MKRAISAALLAIIAVVFAACTHETQDPVDAIQEDAPLAGEITVSCYDGTTYEWLLREAAELFEQKHPDTKINISSFSKMPETVQKYMTMDDPNQQEPEIVDYIKRLNTQLMSGQGPDILAMDVLPYYKYAESGLLDDLRIYMEADESFDIGAYRSNIFDGVKYKGGQYIIPLDFRYYFIWFDKSRLSVAAASKLIEKGKFSYQEMMGIIEKQFAEDNSNARAVFLPDKFALQFAFRILFEGDYKKYVDLENKKASFVEGDFVQLLHDLNEQSQSGYFAPKLASSDEWSQDRRESNNLYYYYYDACYVLQMTYDIDRNASTILPFPKTDEIAGLMTNSSGEVAFEYTQGYGINRNSKNKALAWEFIKHMLSTEMQQSYNLFGEPVNNNAFAEISKRDLLKIESYIGKEDGFDGLRSSDFEYHEKTEEKYVYAYEKFFEWHNGFADELKFCPVTDKNIQFMIEKEVAEFFSGSKSAEMVADTLQNKIWLYLNE